VSRKVQVDEVDDEESYARDERTLLLFIHESNTIGDAQAAAYKIFRPETFIRADRLWAHCVGTKSQKNKGIGRFGLGGSAESADASKVSLVDLIPMTRVDWTASMIRALFRARAQVASQGGGKVRGDKAKAEVARLFNQTMGAGYGYSADTLRKKAWKYGQRYDEARPEGREPWDSLSEDEKLRWVLDDPRRVRSLDELLRPEFLGPDGLPILPQGLTEVNFPHSTPQWSKQELGRLEEYINILASAETDPDCIVAWAGAAAYVNDETAIRGEPGYRSNRACYEQARSLSLVDQLDDEARALYLKKMGVARAHDFLSMNTYPVRLGVLDLGHPHGFRWVALAGWEHRHVYGLLKMASEKGGNDIDAIAESKHDFFMVVDEEEELSSITEDPAYQAFLALRTGTVPYMMNGTAVRKHRLDHEYLYTRDASDETTISFRLSMLQLDTLVQFKELCLEGMAGLSPRAPVYGLLSRAGMMGSASITPMSLPDGDIYETKCLWQALKHLNGLRMLFAKAKGTCEHLHRPYIFQLWSNKSLVNAVCIEENNSSGLSRLVLRPVSILLDGGNEGAARAEHNR
jgi:hypothetical protein